ncbi:MAG: matrixin family metalloprotease, partial [Planctomycetia bacterium]
MLKSNRWLEFEGRGLMTVRRRWQFDRLEDRLVLSAGALLSPSPYVQPAEVDFGPWPESTRLTLSFAPDGVAVADRENQSARMDALLGEEWRSAVLTAFQTWAAEADLEIELIEDAGRASGVGGLAYGQGSQGDLRIVAVDQPADVYAVAAPYGIVAGAWSGDILFNAAVDWSSPEAPDFTTVALHEAGHALGLPFSDDPDSVMNNTYRGPKTTLTAADTAAIRDLYGARSADAPRHSASRTVDPAEPYSIVARLGGDPGDRHRLPIDGTSATAVVQALGDGDWQPTVQLYDAVGDRLAVEVVSRQDGWTVVHAVVPEAAGEFHWVVAADGPVGVDATYALTVRFGHAPPPRT